MNITFQSLISIIVFSGLTVFIIHIIMEKNLQVLNKWNGLFLVCIFIMVVRFLIPVEFPLARNIIVGNLLPEICKVFYTLKIPVGDNLISLITLLSVLWIIGAVFNIILLFISYFRLWIKIYNLPGTGSNEIDDIINEINRKYKKPAEFKIVTTEVVTSPFVFGLVKPYIVIPNITLTGKEWYYILSHETTHYYHKDPIINFLFSFLQAIIWWNPLIHILRNQALDLLEINVDATVTKQLNVIQKYEYLECLIKTAKDITNPSDKRFASAFHTGGTLAVSKRSKLILSGINTIDKKSLFLSYIVLIFLFITSLFLPNLFVFEPFVTPVTQEDVFELDKELSFYIKNDDGTYDLYTNDMYLITVPTIFDEDIKVYNNLKEVLGNETN